MRFVRNNSCGYFILDFLFQCQIKPLLLHEHSLSYIHLSFYWTLDPLREITSAGNGNASAWVYILVSCCWCIWSPFLRLCPPSVVLQEPVRCRSVAGGIPWTRRAPPWRVTPLDTCAYLQLQEWSLEELVILRVQRAKWSEWLDSDHIVCLMISIHI